jgi:hypothetical protein
MAVKFYVAIITHGPAVQHAACGLGDHHAYVQLPQPARQES